MYAVIKTGGKQYRVSPGDRLRVELLASEPGDTVDFDQVLMVNDGSSTSIGSPLVSGSVVSAKVISNGRDKKVKIIKFRRRKHYRRQMGHRQHYTELEIVSVNGVTAPASSKDEKKTPAAAPNAEVNKSASEAKAPQAPAPKFLDAPNGDADDLKKILGIGSVLEEKLNGMGIYHYSQIAELSDEDTASINTYLNFPSRIERDEWIPQAKELMSGGEARKLRYLDASEGEADDLKLISGVGPVLEEKLNELGIYHFWQIAKFEQRDIDLVDEAMAFPGRITRDEWIAQSKNLADGGEPK